MSRAPQSDTQRESSLDVSTEALEEITSEVSRLAREYFSGVKSFRVVPDTHAGETTAALSTELSEHGESITKLIDDCRTVMALSRHNGHPRFFGYVASPSTPVGAYADLIASALNSNLTCWRSAPAGTEIEKIVVRWLGSLIGYGQDSKGLLTSGGSMANLIALSVASRRVAGTETSTKGLWNSDAPLTVYVTSEVHFSVPKAVDVLNLGRRYVRTVDCDPELRMKPESLRSAIESDLSQGFRPFCVVATAGTVATGAVDPLADIAEVAHEFGLWFHVDGAYGAPAALDATKRDLLSGLNEADSVSLDPHKWLYVPVDAGCLLFKQDEPFRATFSAQDVEYIRTHGYADDEAFAFWDYGVELSRRFRALKVWLTLRYYGANRIAAAISDDIALASYLAKLVNESEDFGLLAPVTLSICCFRYVPPALRERLAADEPDKVNEEIDQLNARIMSAVQTGGRAYISNASVRGRFALRVCITNFRTTRTDVEETLSIIRQTAIGLTRPET